MQFQEEITENEAEEVEEEAKVIDRPRKQLAMGIVLSIFTAIVLIMIGGLASYYYYTIQSQGSVAEKVLRDSWERAVDDGDAVAKQFDKISKFEDLTGELGTDLVQKVATANRNARDGAITVMDQAGLSIKATETANKLNKFLLADAEMMSEFRRLLEHTADIDSGDDFDQLADLAHELSASYDELLLTGKGIVKGTFPRAVFDIPDDFEQLYGKKTETESVEDAATKALRQAAESVVSKFAEAWKARNADGMKTYLTAGAKGEFNSGILEDSSEIVSLRILSTTIADDKVSATISGQLEKETPDKVKVTELWKFVLLKQGDVWLIDSWKS